jgi:hypothetical protein
MRSMNASTHAAINNSIHIITSNKKRYTINLGIPRIYSLSVLDKATTNIFCIFFSTAYITSLRWIRYGITAFLFSKEFKNKGNEERNDCSQ